MKKWFACIMCFVMMLGLVACGEDANVEIPDEVSGKNDSSAEYVINLASTSLPGQAPVSYTHLYSLCSNFFPEQFLLFGTRKNAGGGSKIRLLLYWVRVSPTLKKLNLWRRQLLCQCPL